MTDLAAENAELHEIRKLVGLIHDEPQWALARVQLAAKLEAENATLRASLERMREALERLINEARFSANNRYNAHAGTLQQAIDFAEAALVARDGAEDAKGVHSVTAPTPSAEGDRQRVAESNGPDVRPSRPSREVGTQSAPVVPEHSRSHVTDARAALAETETEQS